MEDNSIKNIVPSQNDLNKIIESINSNNNLATTVIRSTVSAITRISSIIANADIDKSIKNFSKLDKSLLQYNKVVSSVITSICEKHDNKNLIELLGRQDTIDTEGNIKTTYTTIEAAQQIPNLINNAFRVLDAFNKDGYGFGAAIRMQKNLKLFKKVIGTVLKDMISMFNEINLQYGDSLLKTLVKQPDIIEAYSEKEYDTSNNDNTSNLKKQIENTKTTQGQLGLLDIVTQAFALFGAIAELNPPRFSKFKKKLNLAMSQLQYSFDRIFNFAIENNSKFSSINEFCKSFTSENGVTDLIMSLKMATNQIISTFTRKTKRNLKRSLTGIVTFSEVLSSLDINVINNKALNAMSSKNVGEMLRNSKTNIQKIEEITISLLVISKNLIKLKRRHRRIKLGLNVLVSTIELIDSVLEKLANNSKASDETINIILNKLESIGNLIQTVLDKLKDIGKFILILSLIFISIILLVPVALIASVASLILLLAVWVVTKTIKIMLNLIKNSINPKDFLGIILLISIIALLTIVALVLLKMTEIAQNVVKSALLILGLFGVIIAVTLAAIGLGMLAIQASPVLGMAAGGLALICVTILILTVMAVLLKKLESITLNPDKIKENVETVIVTAKLVINSIFTSSDKEGQDSKESWLGSVLSAVGGMVATLAKSILAIRFLALSIVSIFMVLVLATLLRLIQELNLDPSKIQENVRIVIDTALLVIDTLFKRPDTEANKSDKNWIVSVIETFGGPIVSIIKAIIAIRFLAISIVAILFINILSVQLRLLQALNLEPDKIKENVETVIGTALLVTDTLFKRPDSDGEQSNKNWIVSLIEYIGGPIVKIAQAIIAIRFLAISIASIFLVMILAKQLEQLSKINIDDNIKVKVDSILIAADQVRLSLINRKSTLESNNTDTEKQGLLSRFFPKLSNATRLIASMTWLSAALVSVGMVSELAKQLEIINKLPDTSNTLNNVNILCTTADNIINKLTGNIKLPRRNNKLKLIEQFIEITNNIKPRKVKSTVKLFESSINFVDKINTVDVTKLETSTRMFEQMAKFSSSIQGDFNKLAETLNENLMPVLEELKNIMGQIPEKLDTGFQNTSASIAATTTTQNASTVAAQVKRENPNISTEQQNIEVQRRLNAYNAAEANGMISKIDEMLNLLKGYSGYVKVKTV